MSYILEALRRADAERDRGAVPHLHTQAGDPYAGDDAEPGPRRMLPWLGAALLLALGAGAAALWFTQRAPSPAVERSAAQQVAGAQQGAGAQQVAGAQSTSDGPAPASAAATPPPQAVPAQTAPAPAPGARPAETRNGAAPPPASTAPSPRPAAPPAARRPAAAKPAPEAAPPSPAAAKGTTGTVPGTVTGPAPGMAAGADAARGPAQAPARGTASSGAPTQPVPQPGTAAKAATPAGTAPGPRVHAVAELPEGIRRALPRLAVGASMYDDRPARRMLVLNGQVLREGDALSPDLIVERIQLRSAVLNFRGWRYELAY